MALANVSPTRKCFNFILFVRPFLFVRRSVFFGFCSRAGSNLPIGLVTRQSRKSHGMSHEATDAELQLRSPTGLDRNVRYITISCNDRDSYSCSDSWYKLNLRDVQIDY